MVFMRSSIRNMALFNNTLVEVSHDEEIDNLDNLDNLDILDNLYNFNEPDELQDELQDELNNNQTTLFIVTLRGTSFYFLNVQYVWKTPTIIQFFRVITIFVLRALKNGY